MRINIAEYFLTSVKELPEERCLEYAGEVLTYLQVLHHSLSIAKLFSCTPKTPVVILLPKGNQAICSIIATTLTGNIYVPVDVSAPVERLYKIISSLGNCLVLFDNTTEHLLDKLSKCVSAEFFNVEDASVNVAYDSLDTKELIDRAEQNISNVIDTDPAYVIFTSGSTGTPKGVTVSHRSIIDYIDWANSVYDISNNDIIGSQAPFYFDNSTLDLYLTFSNAACLNIIPEPVFVFPKKLLDYVNNSKITTVFWVPSLLVNIANLDLLSSMELPSLRNVLFAGEVMPAKHLKYWLQQHPNAKYSNLYGPTEITVDCTYFNVPPDWDGDDVPIGIPCKNTDVLILNDDDELSDSGELCVRGSSLALGYWGNTSKTEDVFVQNPTHNLYRDLIYRTGDLVNIRNGLIHFVGRKDFQIKHNGYRIELGEIETVVSNLNCIASCVAGYLPQQKSIYLCAITNEPVSLISFRKLLMDKLPKYMVPTKIEFMSAFPMTPNGKIDRLALLKIVEKGK